MNKNIIASAILAGTVLMGRGFSQPNAPTTPNIPCSATPTGAQNSDTVISTPNSEGFFVLFDTRQIASATNPRGWWQSCQTGHGGPAVFRIDTNKTTYPSVNGSGTGAIYSTQNGNSGGVLMTNRNTFDFYELMFDYWPDYGNDGGIFHRTNAAGRCFQTVLDYLGGASLGGTWGEGGYTGRDQRPFSFATNESTITISNDPNFGWTNFTRNWKVSHPNEAAFPCAATGCIQADWRNNWNFNNWSQLRIKFYAGLTTATNVHMTSYFRRVGQTQWVPISSDTTLNLTTPAGFIGLQVHGGGRFGGPRGTWYKRIWIRPVNITGIPTVNGVAAPNLLVPVMPEAPIFVKTQLRKVQYDMHATSNALVGSVSLDYEITTSDLTGHALEKFSGRAGKFQHEFKTDTYGYLFVTVKTAKGSERFRVNRIPG